MGRRMYTGKSDDSIGKSIHAWAFVACLAVLAIWGVGRLVNGVMFDIKCEGFLKQAADATTIEIAQKRLGIALEYIEDNDLTSGYTSVFYNGPEDDVEFWYTNLKSAQKELSEISPDATPLEKTNVLMKLRETICDEGQSVGVTFPKGISVHPNNKLWAYLAIMAGVVAVILLVTYDDGALFRNA